MTSTRASDRLLLPGLIPREPGLETYRVRAGGVTAVRLGGGDRLDVVDRQGRQPAELTVLGERGVDGGALGLTADVPATVIPRALHDTLCSRRGRARRRQRR